MQEKQKTETENRKQKEKEKDEGEESERSAESDPSLSSLSRAIPRKKPKITITCISHDLTQQIGVKSERLILQIKGQNHSVRKLFTGLAVAARKQAITSNNIDI